VGARQDGFPEVTGFSETGFGTGASVTKNQPRPLAGGAAESTLRNVDEEEKELRAKAWRKKLRVTDTQYSALSQYKDPQADDEDGSFQAKSKMLAYMHKRPPKSLDEIPMPDSQPWAHLYPELIVDAICEVADDLKVKAEKLDPINVAFTPLSLAKGLLIPGETLLSEKGLPFESVTINHVFDDIESKILKPGMAFVSNKGIIIVEYNRTQGLQVREEPKNCCDRMHACCCMPTVMCCGLDTHNCCHYCCHNRKDFNRIHQEEKKLKNCLGCCSDAPRAIFVSNEEEQDYALHILPLNGVKNVGLGGSVRQSYDTNIWHMKPACGLMFHCCGCSSCSRTNTCLPACMRRSVITRTHDAEVAGCMSCDIRKKPQPSTVFAAVEKNVVTVAAQMPPWSTMAELAFDVDVTQIDTVDIFTHFIAPIRQGAPEIVAGLYNGESNQPLQYGQKKKSNGTTSAFFSKFF
jgi:hypothetical protein